ncbi:DUF2919 domain-containing protein [Entomohabitans teleogrylli]|uniref:DUF2919 domain-containing protein n=1 Tax=Entomohabitans teleogrylli TaxID=1384589 RepID=UPI00073D8C42|nr:DUF2919 domain-containing protein [Entomohabitans teleogrylli]
MIYLPSDYDQNGNLKLPWLFYLVLLLQARSWVLLLMAGASRQQGEALMSLFWPDRSTFLLSLLPGIPAVVAFLLAGYRQRWPQLWRAWYRLLIVLQLALVGWQAVLIWRSDEVSLAALLLLAADLFAAWWLLTNRRLRACFYGES